MKTLIGDHFSRNTTGLRNNMSDFIQIHTTTETKEDAVRIAKEVVKKRLVACAQVLGPIQSTYWWEGQIETSEEWLCQMKSREDLYSELEKVLKDIHPYEVPEILALPVRAGYQPYLEWMEGELGNDD